MQLLIVRGQATLSTRDQLAAQAYASLLAEHFERVVGLELTSTDFTYPVLSEPQALEEAKRARFTLVLCVNPQKPTPRLPHAVHVGLLTGSACDDLKSLKNLDALWCTSERTGLELAQAGVGLPTLHLPWPSPTSPTSSALPTSTTLPTGLLYSLSARQHTTGFWARAANLGLGVGPFCRQLAVGHLRTTSALLRDRLATTLIAETHWDTELALPMLLAEWLEFKRLPIAQAWNLVLCTDAPVLPLWQRMQELQQQLRVRESALYVAPAGSVVAWLGSAAGLLSASLSNQGSPALWSALLQGKPVLCPQHLADHELGLPNYEFAYPTEVTRAPLPNSDLPTGSAWHLPQAGALAQACSKLAQSSASALQEVCRATQTLLTQKVGPAQVQARVATELSRLQSMYKATGLREAS